jgi:peptidoglycan-N-acetylglucosamine deacetylase
LIAKLPLFLLIVLAGGRAEASIIARLPTQERVLALTFDACEGPRRATLDVGLVDVLRREDVPYTVFMGGRFARDNADAVAELSRDERVEIENHSDSHPQDMRRLDDESVRSEVARAAASIREVTGRSTQFFRFPAGRADDRVVSVVEAMGYRIVHWRFPSGDPDPNLSADAILRDTLARVRAGDILIFHINGRGIHTSEIVPPLLAELRRRGYRFVRLDAVLGR